METADLPNHLRQQLILAQVRLMELEDTRDELTSQLTQAGRTLTELQAIVQDCMAVRDQSVRSGANLEKQLGFAHQQLIETHLLLQQSQLGAAELQTTLDRTKNTVAGHQVRIGELEEQLRNVQSSRSWRWTVPLRALERLFRRPSRE